MGVIKQLLSNPYAMRYVLFQYARKRAGGYTRDYYHHCLDKAAATADALGVPRISVIEFGVAGGNGLVEIERICAALKARRRAAFEIYGFDTGAGLPPPVDYRDLPYQWRQGFFAMDVDKLKKRLTSARLVLGDVKDTVPVFAADPAKAPIGAVFFDLDYYSSTVDALRVLSDTPARDRLPRIPCYFDDIEGISSLGVNLAIQEFNAAQRTMKIENPLKLRHERRSRDWGWKVYEHHDFAHPQYATPIVGDRQLTLA